MPAASAIRSSFRQFVNAVLTKNIAPDVTAANFTVCEAWQSKQDYVSERHF